MSAESIVQIYKWLWQTESYYENIYNDKLQNFLRHREHSLQDYLNLYQAELELKSFLKFSRDLSIILAGDSAE